MAKKKQWVPGVPVAEYHFNDGALLDMPGDEHDICQCPFCSVILRRHLMWEHLKNRFINDLEQIIGECRALQVSHRVRDVGGGFNEALTLRCQQERKSRVEIVLRDGDPAYWK